MHSLAFWLSLVRNVRKFYQTWQHYVGLASCTKVHLCHHLDGFSFRNLPNIVDSNFNILIGNTISGNSIKVWVTLPRATLCKPSCKNVKPHNWDSNQAPFSCWVEALSTALRRSSHPQQKNMIFPRLTCTYWQYTPIQWAPSHKLSWEVQHSLSNCQASEH